MIFKKWLAENTSKIYTVPIHRIVPDMDNMAIALDALHKGMEAVERGPLKVDLINGSKRLSLADGHHRLLRAILDGKTHVDVQLNDNDGLGPSVMPKTKDILALDPNEEYFGLKDKLRNGWLLNRM